MEYMINKSKKARCNQGDCNELSVWEGCIGNTENRTYCEKHLDIAIAIDNEATMVRCNQGENCNEPAVWGGDKSGEAAYCEKHLTPEARVEWETDEEIIREDMEFAANCTNECCFPGRKNMGKPGHS